MKHYKPHWGPLLVVMLSLLTVLAFVACRHGLAAKPTLKIGDRAPALQTGNWVQGERVDHFEKGKAYIVEFWATWCGPCKFSIPHLNEIANKYKDKGLIVIGQDCWEDDDRLVGPFVKGMGEKMTYRVVLDDKTTSKRGKMADTWMDAAGQHGIPTAFFVNRDGVIAWIGHPMNLDDKTVEGVLSGNFDISKFAVEHEKARQEEERLRQVAKEQRDGYHRFQDLVAKKDYADAYKLAVELSDKHQDIEWLQNQLAWIIATDKSIQPRDLALAEKFARRALAANKAESEWTVDTLARIRFMEGYKEEAIQLEQKAVGLAKGDITNKLQQALESYKRGELPDGNY